MVGKSVLAAFSLFSRIPTPRVEWDEDTMRYLMCALPLVGFVVGVLSAAWAWFSTFAGLGSIAFAVGLTVIPIAVTGGIHLDGFVDVVDALASHAEPERKRQILKDPHIGSFAIIGFVVYILLYVGCSSELRVNDAMVLGLLCLLPILSRVCAGIAALAFPRSASEGMLFMFQKSARKEKGLVVLGIEFVACVAALIALRPVAGVAMVLGSLVVGACLYRMAMRQFGGINGDLAGFYVQVGELVMLACLVVSEAIVL